MAESIADVVADGVVEQESVLGDDADFFAEGGELNVAKVAVVVQVGDGDCSGGTLAQHIDGHKLADGGTHDVEIYENTQLARVLGAGVHSVNSRHHQAVAEVGAGLKVSSKSPEGVIEGLERPDLCFAIAVQWHPEDMLEKVPLQRRLFEEFVKHLSAP
jgi:gamma-glutamyl-gamma-aminobutyrate hydrolase PuuD